jgi:hypothetical protein
MVSLTIECFCEEHPAESGVPANSVSLLFAGSFVRDHRAGNAPSRVLTPSVPDSEKDCGSANCSYPETCATIGRDQSARIWTIDDY